METTNIVLIVLAALSLCVLALAALFGRRSERSSGPDHAAIRQYREWQGQAATWSTYYELEDMIDEERAKGC